jgi:predicted dehydrogenase
MKTALNLGIIGYGNIGKLQWKILTLSDQTDFRVSAVSDLNPYSIPAGTKFYQDYHQLLADPDISAVSICTPPDSHFAIAKNALMAGKHVLVEKPPALNVEQCRSLIDLAKDSNKTLFMAFHARYHSAVEAAKLALKNKNIRRIVVTYKEYVLNYHSVDNWVFNPLISGGGVLMDSGINALSVINEILSDNPGFKVSRVKFVQADGFNVEVQASISFKFNSNGSGIITMDWLHQGPEVRRILFTTSEGDSFTVDIVSNTLSLNGKIIFKENVNSISVDQVSEYRSVYKDFVSHIALHKSLTSTKELLFIHEAYSFASVQNKKLKTISVLGV